MIDDQYVNHAVKLSMGRFFLVQISFKVIFQNAQLRKKGDYVYKHIIVIVQILLTRRVQHTIYF